MVLDRTFIIDDHMELEAKQLRHLCNYAKCHPEGGL